MSVWFSALQFSDIVHHFAFGLRSILLQLLKASGVYRNWASPSYCSPETQVVIRHRAIQVATLARVLSWTAVALTDRYIFLCLASSIPRRDLLATVTHTCNLYFLRLTSSHQALYRRAKQCIHVLPVSNDFTLIKYTSALRIFCQVYSGYIILFKKFNKSCW